MPRLLVIERDAARRDALHFLLSQAGFTDIFADQNDAISKISQADLTILGDDDLQLLELFPQFDGRLAVSVLVLIDPGNCESLLKCLEAGVTKIYSRQRTGEELVAQIRCLLEPHRSSSHAPDECEPDATSSLSTPAYRQADLISALRSVCEDVARLQEQNSVELTHRRKVEQALMESEAFYQSLVETLPLAMLRKDLSGRFTFANRLLCEAFKRPVEAIIGHSDHDFFPRELAEKYRADDRLVLETRCNFETTEEFQSPTGERRYTHVVKSPVYDAANNLVGIQGIFSDVTEKERAERELFTTKARLQAVMDAATQVAIISTDNHGAIDLFNTGAERMLGYQLDEVLGRTPEIFHLPAEIEARGEVLTKQFDRPIRGFDVFLELARRGDHEEREWTYIRKDGSQLKVMLSVTSKVDHEGRVNGFLTIATDITVRYRAEAVMLKAKEAAEAANRAKSDFLANMSHEIRTPLNAIIGMTELVRDTDLNVTQREYLSMVQESGESLLAVINDILDFSKIEAGKLNLERVSFNLREVLGDTMKSLALRAHRKQLELACHVATSVPTGVEGDPHRLRQIVVNLVGNAIKFTEQGEVILDVEVEQIDGDDIVLHFQVTDTGIGISADQLHTIFEAFEQADTSTTRRYGGTGLGLAISSRLVELMRGRIWVESELGKGSTFHFLIHFAKSTSDTEVPGSVIYPPMLNGLNVLIVDDNSTNRRILVEILTNWMMNPTAVSGVTSAISELKRASENSRPFDLVLTDAHMPEADGFELARQIQQNNVLCRSMVMMLTSGDRPNDIKRCSELGVSAYLVKPIKQSELLESILVAIGGQSSITGSFEKTAIASRKSSFPKSILLAEDSLINQKLAIGLLEKWGHHVTVANDGHEAVHLSGTKTFDLVLMDVQMPELDGLDATRAIRRREQLTGVHLPILAMTAHAMKGDRERCLEAGMDDYLMKPIRADQLFQALERIGAASVSSSNTQLESGQFRSESQLVDWDLARQAVNQDEELLNQVVEAFLEECPQLMTTLMESAKTGDVKRFQRAAHTLKSGLRMFGVQQLADDVEGLELTAKKGGLPPEVNSVVDSLEPRSKAILFEMNQHLNSTSR